MVTIPDDFATAIINQAGDAGRTWIDRLPIVVEGLCRRWDLVVDGAPMHGYLGVVVPVKRRDELCVLKVSWIDETTAHEISALSVWNGRGAVRLLEAEPELAVMLLERLNSRRSLRDVEIGKAVAVAGHLLRRLSVPAPSDLPLLKVVAERLSETLTERWDRLGRPMPRRLIDAARDSAVQLGPSAGSTLVNYDLHDGNVLAGDREPWLAIDPKVVVGDPEFGIAQLLWTRLEDLDRAGGLSRHFTALVDEAGLDLDRARSWTLVRCVDYWLWALSIGLTEDPARCEVITQWLAS
ncbi:MAG TPA: aminoglycoside phosphotransferase family protein [Chloroflexota bacterium]|nr:aminoglycoside phosphotransferase family protein [Chloroflexota bacterium]